MRALTPLELAVAVSLTGTVAATMIPTFLRNVHASRLSEPVEGLKRIAAHATLRAAGLPPESAYPESAPFTPAVTPRGELVLDAPGTWTLPPGARWTSRSMPPTRTPSPSRAATPIRIRRSVRARAAIWTATGSLAASRFPVRSTRAPNPSCSHSRSIAKSSERPRGAMPSVQAPYIAGT